MTKITTKGAVYEIRRTNLARLLAERGAKTALALKLGCNQTHITHLLSEPSKPGHRQVHEDVARAIEHHIGLTPGSLDREPGASAAPQNSALLEEAVRTVIAAAIEAHAKLAADKTAGIVRLVYEHSLAAGRVDASFVAQLVKLMR